MPGLVVAAAGDTAQIRTAITVEICRRLGTRDALVVNGLFERNRRRREDDGESKCAVHGTAPAARPPDQSRRTRLALKKNSILWSIPL